MSKKNNKQSLLENKKPAIYSGSKQGHKIKIVTSEGKYKTNNFVR